ncbi:hypothetical protein HK102_008681, partial [Quaeritorhiza haematococci]
MPGETMNSPRTSTGLKAALFPVAWALISFSCDQFRISKAAPVQSLIPSPGDLTPTGFHPIPIPGQDTPTNELVGKYIINANDNARDVSANEEQDLLNVNIRTLVPALNLDNVQVVRSVVCTKDRVKISLTGGASALANQWRTHIQSSTGEKKGLLLMINPRYRCALQATVQDGHDQSMNQQHQLQGAFAFRFATSVIRADPRSNTIELSASHIPAQDLKHYADEYTMSIQESLPSDERLSLEVRNDNEFTIGLDWDWSPSPSTPIASDPTRKLTATCANCWFRGNAYVHLNVTGRFAWIVPVIKMDVSGMLDANFELDLTIGEREAVVRNVVELYRRNLKNYSVPGLISINPWFTIDAGLTIAKGPELKVQSGFEITVPAFRLEVVGHQSSTTSTPEPNPDPWWSETDPYPEPWEWDWTNAAASIEAGEGPPMPGLDLDLVPWPVDEFGEEILPIAGGGVFSDEGFESGPVVETPVEVEVGVDPVSEPQIESEAEPAPKEDETPEPMEEFGARRPGRPRIGRREDTGGSPIVTGAVEVAVAAVVTATAEVGAVAEEMATATTATGTVTSVTPSSTETPTETPTPSPTGPINEFKPTFKAKAIKLTTAAANSIATAALPSSTPLPPISSTPPASSATPTPDA